MPKGNQKAINKPRERDPVQTTTTTTTTTVNMSVLSEWYEFTPPPPPPSFSFFHHSIIHDQKLKIEKSQKFSIHTFSTHSKFRRVQLGKGDNNRPVNFRKVPLYTSMHPQWSRQHEHHLNMSDCLMASCANAGAIAVTRDPTKLVQLRGPDANKQFVYVYSCSGKLISRFEWQVQSRGQLIHLGWTHDECVICVTR